MRLSGASGAAYRVREAVREDLDALVDMIGQMALHHGDSASIDAEVLA